MRASWLEKHLVQVEACRTDDFKTMFDARGALYAYLARSVRLLVEGAVQHGRGL